MCVHSVSEKVCVSICHLTARQLASGNQSQCVHAGTCQSTAAHACRITAGIRLQGPRSSVDHWEIASG